MLIGREKERRELLGAYESDEAKFVAVYGRRRVGKTYLVRQTFKDKLTFACSGQAHGKLRDQLFGWTSSLRDAGLPVGKTPTSWLEAFDLLKDLIKVSADKKKVIFLDELPWMDTPRSGFVNALEFFWNSWASGREDVLLVVCGSATSWIVNKLFRNHGGLHNRVTHRILVEPFTLNECEQYAKQMGCKYSRYDLLEAYMVLGGIPYYWSFMDAGKSVAQNIDELFFARNGRLSREFEELYHSLFKNPDHYISIVQALGQHLSGLTREEIVRTCKISSSGGLTTILADLEHCGFIRVLPYFGSKKDATYQLIDNYTLFYFKFITQNENNDERYWSNSYLSPVRKSWVGLAFERVCFQHVRQIKQALGIGGVVSNVYSWRIGPSADGEAGAQIDMLIDRADNMVNICEMKFSNSQFTVTREVAMNLRHKAARFSQSAGRNKSINLTMITVLGIAHEGYWGDIQSSITASDLFLPLKITP